MTRHAYPLSAMVGDYLRAAAGLFPTIAILAIGPVGIVGGDDAGWVCCAFCGVRDPDRASPWHPIEVTETALQASGLLRASISWNELDRMKLAYYSTRRDGRGGWMQLELRAGWSTLRVDSRIEGFTELVEASAKAAEMRSLALRSDRHRPTCRLSASSRGPPNRTLGEAAGGRGMTDLLQVRDLHVRFAAPGGFIRAVTGVSFRVRPQSIVALVGESGSGKSVVSQTILRILPRSGVITRGEILFADPRLDGKVVDIAKLPSDGAEMRAIRGGRISIIFQEPMTSLSPLHTIGNQVGEALRLHRR